MTTKKTPKAPQDRKPKAAKVERPEDVKGFELLKSIDEVPVWEQAPLLALVARMTDQADDKGNIHVGSEEGVMLLGEIGRSMLPFAVDEKQYTKFASGRTALQDVMNLAIAWTSTLGEDESSDDS